MQSLKIFIFRQDNQKITKISVYRIKRDFDVSKTFGIVYITKKRGNFMKIAKKSSETINKRKIEKKIVKTKNRKKNRTKRKINDARFFKND